MAGVMHLVDTLEAGGAETMCVLLANALAEDGWQVHICATRRGGPLEKRIGSKVEYLVLGRRSRFDGGALLRLRRYVIERQIRLLHAHGTAVFVAAAVRMTTPGVRVVWHAHAGSLGGSTRAALLYRALSRWVDGVAAVNTKLAEWASKQAGFAAERVWVVPNFTDGVAASAAEDLPGTQGFRIVQVANVRPQKDHEMMLRAMGRVVYEEPRAHLLVVGSCGEVGHGGRVRRLAKELGLSGHVSFLGTREDVAAVLEASDIGVLSSASEGLPVALLEYGEAGLGVVCTDVGDCRRVVEGAGVAVAAGDDRGMAEAVLELLRDSQKRREMGARLRERVRAEWSREAAVRKVQEIYAEILG